jgi:hypothetical protein
VEKTYPHKCDECGSRLVFADYIILDKDEKPDRALMRFWCKIICNNGHTNIRTIEIPNSNKE